MNTQNAIDALALQNERFNDILRNIDGGIWWGSDVAARTDADAIFAQAAQIQVALDEIVRLAKQVSA